MNAGMTFGQLKSSETIPDGSIFPISMGDGTGSRKVTMETLVTEIGKDLKIGDLNDLKTQDKTSLVEAINEAATLDVLDTKEEIEANTEAGKIAGAQAVKEMVGELNDNLSDLNTSLTWEKLTGGFKAVQVGRYSEYMVLIYPDNNGYAGQIPIYISDALLTSGVMANFFNIAYGSRILQFQVSLSNKFRDFTIVKDTGGSIENDTIYVFGRSMMNS